MNFFEQQDVARRRTGWLLLLFFLAVLCLIGMTCLLVALAVIGVQDTTQGSVASMAVLDRLKHISPDTYWQVALSVICLVGLASLFRWFQLSRGGAAVADSLGGRLINANTNSHEETVLINVVEEMAIASGVPVPSVYLLEEQGINAFAAGSRPDNAVIGITRGALQTLNREELQGVVAHEFSHILNGDMRLNMRLVGMLYGILVIGLVGQHILRGFSRGGFRSRNQKGALGFLGLAVGLMVVGYAGTFFGNLIKAAVSRQREFLADASAVQFTRSTDGIAGALEKIAGGSAGSDLTHPDASEISHMLFSQGFSSHLNSLFATHPPLSLRVERLRGESVPIESSFASVPADSQPSGPAAPLSPQMAGFSGSPVDVEHVSAMSGSLSSSLGERQTLAARQLIASFPAVVIEAAHEPYGARALVYALMLSENDSAQQFMLLKQQADSVVFYMVGSIAEVLRPFRSQALTLVDLALPALRQLSDAQQQAFISVMQSLVDQRKEADLYCWSLLVIICGSLHKQEPDLHVSVGNIKILARQLQLLCAVVAYAGVGSTSGIKETLDSEQMAIVNQSFAKSTELLGLKHAKLIAAEDISLQQLILALKHVRSVKPLKKPRILKALATAAAQDGVIQPLEFQIVRAMAQCIDCPVPAIIEENPAKSI